MTGTTGAVRRQTEIFLGGLRGAHGPVPIDPQALEDAARAAMSPKAFAYVAGGAGQERTVARNRSAFDRWWLVPRVLRDIARRDLGVELFGRRLPAPLLLAPVGVLELAHDDADVAVARAAAASGLPLIVSNQASRSLEAIAEAAGDAPRWFQLYWSKSEALNASLVRRAEASGCDAIVVTLDTALLGWRIRDLDLGFLPFLAGQGIAQYLADPVFCEGLPDAQPARTEAAVHKFLATYAQPSLGWDDLVTLRRHTKLPILVKGVLHPDDAARARDVGIDGVIVSNHGGRQVDGALGALDALPAVVDALDDRIPALFDSGVRGGADAVKALALGARAVCIGRPYVYGLAVAGEAGVRAVLANLLAEIELTMALIGCAAIRDLDRECLRAAG